MPMAFTNFQREGAIISDTATGVFPLGPAAPFPLIFLSGDTVSGHATALPYIASTY